MELDKFEQKQVATISKLQERSNELQVTAYKIIVGDDVSLKEANAVIKQINAHKKLVKEERLALTQPLNNVVNQLIAKEKEVLLPLDEGKTELSDKIISYSEEVERKRQEEIRRVDAIITGIEYWGLGQMFTIEDVDQHGKGVKQAYEELDETDQNIPSVKVAFMTTVGKLTDRKNQIIEEARVEAERVRQAEEQKRLDAEREKQSVEEARLAAERKANEDAKREIEEAKLQMQRDKEEIERQKEIQKAEAEALKLEKKNAQAAKSAPKTNQVTTTKFEITDPDNVPYIYCSPDESKIRQAIKDGYGASITGVRIYEETKVR